MDHVASGGYEMVGTFNGNPLAMAAARAMLTEVATEDAYRRIEGLRHARRRGHQRGDRGLRTERWRGDRRAPRAASSSRPEPVSDYRGSSPSTTR